MSRDYDEPCEDCGRPVPFGVCRRCRSAARFQARMDAHEDPPPPEEDDDCEPPEVDE